MYLRHTTRRKDGKVHKHRRLVRSVRVGREVVQQTVAPFTCVRSEGDHFVYFKPGILRPIVIPDYDEVRTIARAALAL